jgi:hypothetical protein
MFYGGAALLVGLLILPTGVHLYFYIVVLLEAVYAPNYGAKQRQPILGTSVPGVTLRNRH